MDIETLLLTIIILGISSLLGISTLIPNILKERNHLGNHSEKNLQPFSRGVFLGMIFPIILLIILGIAFFITCKEGYCTEKNITRLLSGFGITGISIIIIKIISPIFIGEIFRDNKKGGDKNIINYIAYILLFSGLFLTLLIVDPTVISNKIRIFINDFGVSREILGNKNFETFISRIFYIFTTSILVGILSSLRMITKELERRGNEELQAKKLHDFIEKNSKI